MNYWIKVFKAIIEGVTPFLWKTTKRMYMTTYYCDVECVHLITRRYKHLENWDWVYGKLENEL